MLNERSGVKHLIDVLNETLGCAQGDRERKVAGKHGDK
jgi:hypothetical protein